MSVSHRRSAYRQYYATGKHVKLALADFESKVSMLTKKEFLEQLATEAGEHPMFLSDCVRVASVFTKRELDALAARPEISWPLIVNLSAVIFKSERDKLIELICANRWTQLQLVAAITGQKPPQKSPRQPKPPRNINVALDRLQKHSAKFLESAGRLFGEGYFLPVQIQWTPPDDLTADTQTQVQRTIELLETIARQATDDAQQLREVGLSWIAQVLQVRSERR